MLCSTFTGIVFGLTRSESFQSVSSNFFSKDSENIISTLKNECEQLEKQIFYEKDKYQSLTSKLKLKKKFDQSWSVLPYFEINDSIILQQG